MDKVNVKVGQPYPNAPGWSETTKSKMGQLPFVEDSGVAIGQSVAIVNYLARKFGLDKDLSLADYGISQELIQQSADIHDFLGKAKYSGKGKEGMDAVFAEGGIASKTFAAFEPHVSSSGFFGSVCTPGDLAFAAGLNLLTRLEPECLSAFPNLSAFNAKIQANAGIKAVNEGAPYGYFTRDNT